MRKEFIESTCESENCDRIFINLENRKYCYFCNLKMEKKYGDVQELLQEKT